MSPKNNLQKCPAKQQLDPFSSSSRISVHEWSDRRGVGTSFEGCFDSMYGVVIWIACLYEGTLGGLMMMVGGIHGRSWVGDSPFESNRGNGLTLPYCSCKPWRGAGQLENHINPIRPAEPLSMPLQASAKPKKSHFYLVPGPYSYRKRNCPGR